MRPLISSRRMPVSPAVILPVQYTEAVSPSRTVRRVKGAAWASTGPGDMFISYGALLMANYCIRTSSTGDKAARRDRNRVIKSRYMLHACRISRRRSIARMGSGLLIPAIPCIVSALVHDDPTPKFRGKTLDGESISNDSLLGKTVLFQFWATWCPYCKADMPALERILQE